MTHEIDVLESQAGIRIDKFLSINVKSLAFYRLMVYNGKVRRVV